MQIARQGAREGEVVVAETQSAGRGRLGRSFFLACRRQLYGSIVLRPNIPPARAPQITLVAGLAVADAWSGTRYPSWAQMANDVRLGAGKVCGILTEMECEADRVLHVVCGPGVNLNVSREDFPEDLRSTATSILAASGRTVDRAAFAADLFACFERLMTTSSRTAFAICATRGMPIRC